jgi:hypothetical protein
MNMKRKILALTAVCISLAVFLTHHVAASHQLVCSTETTLSGLVTCIKSSIPLSAAEGFTVPTSAQLLDWRAVVRSMLQGQCTGIAIPTSLSANYTITQMTDGGNKYCIFYENVDANDSGKVDRGWGTVIIRETPTRNIGIHIAHPLFDSNTPEQGIGIFTESGARNFVLAGAHRNTNDAASSCQASYKQADSAHDTNTMFDATVREMEEYYSQNSLSVTSIQYHAMGAGSCAGVDVYLTHGSTSTPSAGEAILTLQSKLSTQNPSWAVKVPGDTPTCTLNGTENIQGRLINGVADNSVCGTSATTYNQRFIHVEQKAANRSLENWSQAIQDSFPVIATIGGRSRRPIDNTPPVLLQTVPASGDESVHSLKELELQFDEMTVVYEGNIRIFTYRGGEEIAVVPVRSKRVTGSGSPTIVVNVEDLLEDYTSYYVIIEEDAFHDEGGFLYEGFTDTETWKFATGDSKPPTIQNVLYSESIMEGENTSSWAATVSFTEQVFARTGHISIVEDSRDEKEKVKIDVNKVEGWGSNSIVIPILNPLREEMKYKVIIPNGILADAAGNAYHTEDSPENIQVFTVLTEEESTHVSTEQATETAAGAGSKNDVMAEEQGETLSLNSAQAGEDLTIEQETTGSAGGSGPDLASDSDAYVFTDIREPVVKYAAEQLAQRGMITGKEQNLFYPKELLNRAELITILCRLDEWCADMAKKTVAVAPFKDVQVDAWYAGYIYALKERGVIKGYEDSAFKPHKKINTAEFWHLTMQVYSSVYGENIEMLHQEYNKKRAMSELQKPSIPEKWYTGNMSAAKQLGILKTECRTETICSREAESIVNRGKAVQYLYLLFAAQL